MTYSIVDFSGNSYKFNQDTGLIYKNSVIVSGEDYEPCFLNSPEGPIFTGIYFKKTYQILSISGKISPVTNPETL